MNISEMSDNAKAALLFIASRDGADAPPVRASELDRADTDELCEAGCLTFIFGGVRNGCVVLSMDGCDAVDELRRAS